MDVIGMWRKLHNEELHNLYTSPNMIRVLKLRRIIHAGQVICITEIRIPYKVFDRKSERVTLETSCTWKIILRL
jgi:hypothetical protein